jgi:hypothetical protein
MAKMCPENAMLGWPGAHFLTTALVTVTPIGRHSRHHPSLLAFNRARRRRCRSRRLSAVSFRRPACRRACAQATLRCRSAVARSSSV